MTVENIPVTRNLEIPSWSMTEEFVLAGGPGGQNVNKNATAVQLRFYPETAGIFTDAQRRRLIQLAGKRAAKDGSILVEARRHRTQERNREDARDRLKALVIKALEPPPPPRRKTRPTRGSVERRLKKKTIRSQVKKSRGSVDLEE